MHSLSCIQWRAQKCYQHGLGTWSALLAMIRCIWAMNGFALSILPNVWHKHSFTPRPIRTQNSKPKSGQNVICKICFCFSHWVFNVYCILKRFFVIAYCSLTLLLSRTQTFTCKLTFENKRLWWWWLQWDWRHLATREYVCACRCDFNLVQQSVAVAATSYSQFKFVAHICQFIFILCWSDFLLTTVPMLGLNEFAFYIEQFLPPFICTNRFSLLVKWLK